MLLKVQQHRGLPYLLVYSNKIPFVHKFSQSVFLVFGQSYRAHFHFAGPIIQVVPQAIKLFLFLEPLHNRGILVLLNLNSLS